MAGFQDQKAKYSDLEVGRFDRRKGLLLAIPLPAIRGLSPLPYHDPMALNGAQIGFPVESGIRPYWSWRQSVRASENFEVNLNPTSSPLSHHARACKHMSVSRY